MTPLSVDSIFRTENGVLRRRVNDDKIAVISLSFMNMAVNIWLGLGGPLYTGIWTFRTVFRFPDGQAANLTGKLPTKYLLLSGPFVAVAYPNRVSFIYRVP
jgi:hypothetical protein